MRIVAAALSLFLLAGAASAAKVDMNDPRRALGREDNIRVDAELVQDTLFPNGPLSITYQVENLGKLPIAVADRVTDMSYDADTLTLTFTIGTEVPTGTTMPHLVVIAPGQKRVLTAGGSVHITVARLRTAGPRFVQIKVNVLKDVTPFAPLIAQQSASASPVLPNDLFDKWVDANNAVFLNTIPVRWDGAKRNNLMEASERRPTAGGGE